MVASRLSATLGAILGTALAACTKSEECDLSDCGRNKYALTLQQRFQDWESRRQVDTLKAGGETALVLIIDRLGTTGSRSGLECVSCNTLLSKEELYSEHDVLANGEVFAAGVNLLDSTRTGKLGSREPGSLTFTPGLRFRKGSNRLRYEADMVHKGKTLLVIRDTVRFWVDSAAGH